MGQRRATRGAAALVCFAAAPVSTPPNTWTAVMPTVAGGMNAVLGSLPLGPGDEVVITDLAYGAIGLAAAAVCDRAGATLRTVHLEYRYPPLPTSSNRSSLRSLRTRSSSSSTT